MTLDTRTRWVGTLVREIEQAGFTVTEFARRMGVHRTTIWRFNRGDWYPKQEWTARAEALLADPADTGTKAA